MNWTFMLRVDAAQKLLQRRKILRREAASKLVVTSDRGVNLGECTDREKFFQLCPATNKKRCVNFKIRCGLALGNLIQNWFWRVWSMANLSCWLEGPVRLPNRTDHNWRKTCKSSFCDIVKGLPFIEDVFAVCSATSAWSSAVRPIWTKVRSP